MTSKLESTDLETPVVFGEAGEIFGIYTSGPVHGRTGAVLCLSPDMGARPVGAMLARRLASMGIPVLRFDLPGHGESLHADVGGLGSGAPFLAAIDWMTAKTMNSFVIIGGSDGARPALAAASQVENMEGLVLTRLTLRSPARRTSLIGALRTQARRPFDSRRRRESDRSGPFDWSRTVDPQVLGYLRTLMGRSAPLLVVSGSGDTDQLRLQRVIASGLPDLDIGSLEYMTVSAMTLAGFRSVAGQSQFLEATEEWLSRLSPS